MSKLEYAMLYCMGFEMARKGLPCEGKHIAYTSGYNSGKIGDYRTAYSHYRYYLDASGCHALTLK